MEQKLDNPKIITTSLNTALPYNPSLTKPIKKILVSHDIKMTDSSGTDLRDLILTYTKPTALHLTYPNVIYGVPCNDCPATHHGKNYRPVHKRISKHESDFNDFVINVEILMLKLLIISILMIIKKI